MNTRLATTVVIAALVAPMPGYAADSKATKENLKDTVNDTVITTKIVAKYARDKDVSALKIKVDTDDKGVVTLRGKARSNAEADRAVTIARSTKGVTAVKSEIKVQAN